MGSFSFMFCNKQFRDDRSTKNIVYHHPFVLLFPDGRKWKDKSYQDYGIIRNPETHGEVDVHALLAFWNRDYILKHYSLNNYICSDSENEETNDVRRRFFNTNTDIESFRKELESGNNIYNEALRYIGIDMYFDKTIANNPEIKHLKFVNVRDANFLNYNDLPKSNDDPNQGWFAFTSRYNADLGTYY